MNHPIGVLFMAYGGPNSLDELPGYLADIQNGRPTSPEVLDEITNNYRRIGGRSPLLELTRQQIVGVMGRLNRPGQPEVFKSYLGMRHWSPWIEETVGTMIDDGITHAISVVLAPHYSKLSIAKYQKKIAAGLEMYRGDITFEHINSYHDAPGFIEALASRVQEGLSRWPAEERHQVHVVFSAHSLPTRILKMGDPYDAQLRETAQLVADKAGLPGEQWSWSYQSAGRSPEPWLGPQLEDYLPELAAQGIRDVVSIPVGFVCDHMEILYDIDIEYKHRIEAAGGRLERIDMPGASRRMMSSLAHSVRRTAAESGWM